MNNFKHFILILAAFIATACTDSNKAYVRKAVRIMDKEGLFAEGPQWDTAKAEALAAAPATLEEAHRVVEAALKVAGGKHSFLQDAATVTQNATSEDWPAPQVSFQDDGIAIIKLPPFSGNSEEGVKYANAVLDALPADAPLKGAVIDLRDNRGGNMYPMIAAVHRFISDEEIIRFRTRKRTQWVMLDNAVQIAGIARQPHIDCPVAVLTDEWTGSSGEVVLISFRGLEGVRVFGVPTAGYASSNKPFPMPDGSSLVLTTGCDVARTGEAFCDDPIAPDVSTETPLEDALAWLRSL